MPYGVYAPMIQNCMNRDTFIFVRRYIHFTDNGTCKEKNDPLFDPLYKVRDIMDKIIFCTTRGWIAGQRITIDDSMIKCMGRAVTCVQYMLAKPIKHGIKVFACCCAVTGVLLNFEVYLGKENGTLSSTALDIVKRLIESADLTQHKGRILYTDNWYTSFVLAKVLFEK